MRSTLNRFSVRSINYRTEIFGISNALPSVQYIYSVYIYSYFDDNLGRLTLRVHHRRISNTHHIAGIWRIFMNQARFVCAFEWNSSTNSGWCIFLLYFKCSHNGSLLRAHSIFKITSFACACSCHQPSKPLYGSLVQPSTNYIDIGRALALCSLLFKNDLTMHHRT